MKIETERICPACNGEGWFTIIAGEKGRPCPCCGIRGYDPDPVKLKKWEEENDHNRSSS